MAEDTTLTSQTWLVAIDIGKSFHAVLVEGADGRRQQFRMANSVDDYDRLVAFLRGLPGTVRIALEPTGDFHRTLAHRLLREGFPVVSVSSVAGARYREAMYNSWDKNDPKDATVILHLLNGTAPTGIWRDPDIPLLPGVEGRLTDAELAADLGGGGALLGLTQRLGDLLLGEPRLLHRDPPVRRGPQSGQLLKSETVQFRGGQVPRTTGSESAQDQRKTDSRARDPPISPSSSQPSSSWSSTSRPRRRSV
jgi:Transposase